MKKILLYSLMLLSSVTFWSCKDDDNSTAGGENSDRLFRPMFRNDNNTGKGDTDPYNCVIVDLNNAQLSWYVVNDAVAYEIKWAIQNYVANGEDAWIEAEQGVDGKELAGHIVVADPTQYSCLIKHLSYQTDYRFAIRALNSFDKGTYPLFQDQADIYDILGAGDAAWKNDPKNSLWYGYGNGREWAEYQGLTTGVRYEVPFVIQVSDITKTSMHITLNRNIANYTDAQKAIFREHFNFLDADENILKIDYLTFTASLSTPNATENPTYVKFDIPETAWDENGIYEFDVEGLSENSCYNIDVWDGDIAVKVDACFNSTMKRTKGTPNDPILIKHVPTMQDTIGTDNIYDISKYNSMKLDNIIDSYSSSNETPENQVFYLEGGKAYHFTNTLSIYKGLTLRTRPEDAAQGKRATLYMSGMTQTGNTVNTCNFMLGRQPKAGENSSITLDIDSIRFIDLDVDCPMATNYGHQMEGVGGASGNYFMNMFSNGMGINVTLLEWRNCSFQGLIRGFFRIQGSNDFYIQELNLIDCDFYNCGYYSNNAGDYAYIFADHNGRPKSNILQNVEVAGCVFYNNPKRSIITDNNRNLTWDESVRWKINVHHNTIVNFCTVAANVILNTRYIPGGSELGFHDNLIIMTKDPADVNRVMNSAGWDAREIQGGDGTGKATFNIYNNWTTNDEEYLNNGQPFNSYAFNATSNTPGKWQKSMPECFSAGTSELIVHLDESLRATDLMVSPNPKHFIGPDPTHLDYHTDNGIEGLYYQQTDKVFNSSIYQKKVGAARLIDGKK